MRSNCQEVANIRGTSLSSLGRHHSAWWSLFTEAAMPQGARTAITEERCSGSKTLKGSWKWQQHPSEEAAPMGGIQHSQSTAL